MFIRRTRLKAQVNLNCQRRRDDPNLISQGKKVDTRSVKKVKPTITTKANNVDENKTSNSLEVKNDETSGQKSNGEVPEETLSEKFIDKNEETVRAVISPNEGAGKEVGNNNNGSIKEVESGSNSKKGEETNSVANASQNGSASANEKTKSTVEPFKMPWKVAEKSLKINDLYSLKNDIIQKDLKNSYKVSKYPPSIGKSQNNLSSPHSPQMNEISKDPSSPFKTTHTRERTLSGSSLIGKRGGKRIRTDSSSSFFDSYSNYTANKLRKMDEQRRLQRAESRKTIAAGVTDKSNLKMFDLIYYNPPGDPMQSTSVSTNVRSKPNYELNQHDPDDPSEGQAADNQNVAPQLKIGDNGEIIVDHKSLQIETTVDPKAKKNLANSSAIVLDEETGMNGFYTRKPRTKDWNKEETIKFYRCLQVMGTDFSCMSGIFPSRSRRELKLKFKREERINGSLIDKAIMYPKEFDIEQLKQQWDDDDRRARTRIANEQKQSVKVPQKKCANVVLTAMQNGDVVYNIDAQTEKPEKGKGAVKKVKNKLNNNDQNQANNNNIKNDNNNNDKKNKTNKNKTSKKDNTNNEDSKVNSDSINKNKNNTNNNINNNANSSNNNSDDVVENDDNDEVVDVGDDNYEDVDNNLQEDGVKVDGNVISLNTKTLSLVTTTKLQNNANVMVLEKALPEGTETVPKWNKKRRKPHFKKSSNNEKSHNGNFDNPANSKLKSRYKWYVKKKHYKGKSDRENKNNKKDLVFLSESLKYENDLDDSFNNNNNSSNRGERTVSGDSFSLDQIENELMTLMNSDDALLDQVELDSLTEAERALLSNPNTPRKEYYKDFIQKSLNNNFNYVNENTKMPLPDISSIMGRLHENRYTAIPGIFNGLPESKQNENINEMESFRAIANNYQVPVNINNTLNGQYLFEANNFGNMENGYGNSMNGNMENGYGNSMNGIGSNLIELTSIIRPCFVPATGSSNFTRLKIENTHSEDSVDSFGGKCLNIHDDQENNDEEQELDIKEIQEILERISEGTMALVSTLDPNNSDKVINEIFYVNKETGELSQKPLNLSEELVQSILEVIS